MADTSEIPGCKEGQSSEIYRPAQRRIPRLVMYLPEQLIPFARKVPMSVRTKD
jgi:hypothetical protein